MTLERSLWLHVGLGICVAKEVKVKIALNGDLIVVCYLNMCPALSHFVYYLVHLHIRAMWKIEKLFKLRNINSNPQYINDSINDCMSMVSLHARLKNANRIARHKTHHAVIPWPSDT